MSDKKYYWFKLKYDFFNSKPIKKLRRIAGGDTYTIIYLKMQLKSLENDGMLFYEGFEDNFALELALDIDENPDNVEMTLQFLTTHNLIDKGQDDKDTYTLPEVKENTGRESSSADRVRRFRQKKQESLQCNVTEIVTCNAELELELELELDIEKDNNLSLKKAKDQTIKKDLIGFIVREWNQYPNLTTHKVETIKRGMKPALLNKIARYTPQELTTAIKNFSGILSSKEHQWSYKWSLDEFLRRGLDRFLDECKPWDREKISGPPGGGPGGLKESRENYEKENGGVF